MNIIDGMRDTLENLSNSGHQMSIATSNAQENVKAFLQHHKINFFKDVEEINMFHFFDKNHAINKLIKKTGAPSRNIIYIGDEVRDIESARSSNIKIIAVGWGYNAPEILQQYGPDCLVHHSQELIPAIETLNNQG